MWSVKKSVLKIGVKTTMQKITGIGVYSMAKVQGLMGAILGLLSALFNIGLTLLVGAIGAGMGGGGVANELLGGGMTVAIVMLVVLPIFFGVSQFIVSLFVGAILNVALKKAGGVELRIESATPSGL